MNYQELLNRVAYENAMIKMASAMIKKAEDEEKKAPETKTGEKAAEVAGKAGDVAENVGNKISEGWNSFKNWAGNNKGMLMGAGTAAVAAPAIDAGLGQIDWFKRRKLLQKLLAGAGAFGLAVPAAHFGGQLFAKSDDKEKPAEDTQAPA